MRAQKLFNFFKTRQLEKYTYILENYTYTLQVLI